jgi:predicted enzyme related to lactoylglutathione lyase
MLQSAIATWFEIPAHDLARATRFYETLTQAKLKHETMGPAAMAVFPHQPGNLGGCLVRMDGYAPASNGSVVYLHLDDVAAALKRAQGAGAEVLVPRTALPEGMGFYAQIRDSEGNRVGLHAMH